MQNADQRLCSSCCTHTYCINRVCAETVGICPFDVILMCIFMGSFAAVMNGLQLGVLGGYKAFFCEKMKMH